MFMLKNDRVLTLGNDCTLNDNVGFEFIIVYQINFLSQRYRNKTMYTSLMVTFIRQGVWRVESYLFDPKNRGKGIRRRGSINSNKFPSFCL